MRTWKGKLNESHRLYVLSADLAWEAIEGTKPWEAVTPVSEQSLTGVVEWLLGLTLSASDFVILWDSRRRKWRHLLESKLETRQYSELWISFSGRTSALRTGRYRRTALNAQNKECGFLLMGCASTKLVIKGDNTYEGTYFNVPLRPLRSIAKMPLEHKKDLVGGEVDDLCPAEGADASLDWKTMGVPLCWQEGKPIQFWKKFCEDFSVAW